MLKSKFLLYNNSSSTVAKSCRTAGAPQSCPSLHGGCVCGANASMVASWISFFVSETRGTQVPITYISITYMHYIPWDCVLQHFPWYLFLWNLAQYCIPLIHVPFYLPWALSLLQTHMRTACRRLVSHQLLPMLLCSKLMCAVEHAWWKHVHC